METSYLKMNLVKRQYWERFRSLWRFKVKRAVCRVVNNNFYGLRVSVKHVWTFFPNLLKENPSIDLTLESGISQMKSASSYDITWLLYEGEDTILAGLFSDTILAAAAACGGILSFFNFDVAYTLHSTEGLTALRYELVILITVIRQTNWN